MLNKLKFKFLSMLGMSATVVNDKDIYLKDVCVEEEFHEQDPVLLVEPTSQFILDQINKEFKTKFVLETYIEEHKKEI